MAFSFVIVTATDLANDSKTVVEIRRKAGVSREELLDRLKSIQFAAGERSSYKGCLQADQESGFTLRSVACNKRQFRLSGRDDMAEIPKTALQLWLVRLAQVFGLLK